MIFIGTEELHSGVFWINEFAEARVAEEIFIDLDGGAVVQRTFLSGGRKIILEAKGSDSGGRSYFTRSQVELFDQWERTGQIMSLIYNNNVYNVMFPANCMSVTPIRDMAGHVPGDIYYGTLTLLEVSV